MKTLQLKMGCVLTGLLILGFASCGGEKRPEGMPDLYPAKVTIVQEGKPLEGGVVTLVNNDSSQSKWIVGGRTDAAGICHLTTQGKFKGVPAGKYKVLVTKSEKTESETAKQPVPADSKAADEYYAKIRKEEKYYEYVEEKYKLTSTSGLEMEITSGTNEQTFDVGKAIQKEFTPLQ
ncbi:MAG: hypothetical protein LBQ54_15175 [Planctomycetaceae bacterium]|jgi:5-hydroxyisourate hydrolase-like protein (transthyretin family)|nr:hypothetical protein [Planctomycetaceae bacterium]